MAIGSLPIVLGGTPEPSPLIAIAQAYAERRARRQALEAEMKARRNEQRSAYMEHGLSKIGDAVGSALITRANWAHEDETWNKRFQAQREAIGEDRRIREGHQLARLDIQHGYNMDERALTKYGMTMPQLEARGRARLGMSEEELQTAAQSAGLDPQQYAIQAGMADRQAEQTNQVVDTKAKLDKAIRENVLAVQELATQHKAATEAKQRYDAWMAGDLNVTFPQTERRLRSIQSGIEKMKSDPNYDEAEAADAIAKYEREIYDTITRQPKSALQPTKQPGGAEVTAAIATLLNPNPAPDAAQTAAKLLGDKGIFIHPGTKQLYVIDPKGGVKPLERGKVAADLPTDPSQIGEYVKKRIVTLDDGRTAIYQPDGKVTIEGTAGTGKASAAEAAPPIDPMKIRDKAVEYFQAYPPMGPDGKPLPPTEQQIQAKMQEISGSAQALGSSIAKQKQQDRSRNEWARKAQTVQEQMAQLESQGQTDSPKHDQLINWMAWYKRTWENPEPSMEEPKPGSAESKVEPGQESPSPLPGLKPEEAAAFVEFQKLKAQYPNFPDMPPEQRKRYRELVKLLYPDRTEDQQPSEASRTFP